MKILVTGGAGFIASHIVDKYIENGHEVIIVDNLTTGRKENINSKAKFYKADITNFEELKSVFEKEKPEIVNHHAAQIDVRKSCDDPVYDATINILGSVNLLELSREFAIKKFIYISSGGACYGEPKELPVKEDYPVAPLSCYGASKHTVEHYLHIYSINYGLKYVVLRYPNVYGERQDPKGEAGVVGIFSEQIIRGETPTIFGDGSKTRDYIYVLDIAEANVLALDRGENIIINLGWGKGISDFEIFESVRRALNSDIKPKYAEKRVGEVDHISCDANLAKELLKFTPKTPLEQGVKNATKFYLKKLKKGL